MRSTMIKRIVELILFSLILFASSCFAIDSSPMHFDKSADRKYIYCNNREFINRVDLADNSNPSARFIMNNDCLPTGKYTLFASHVNHTDKRNDGGWLITENGFDIELDVLFRAKEDTTINLTALGFEVPENTTYYLYGDQYTKEAEWGCFNAWASYLNMTLSEKDSGQKYIPTPIEPTTITIPAGEEVWLSKYIPNYSVVPYYRPVNLITDFEIISGECDVNVAALKSNGTLGDRTNFVKTAFDGPYIYEHQHKGISENANEVNTSLSYTIDDSVKNETALPVTVYNQIAPNGNMVSSWISNLSPRSDSWNQSKIPEDSLLAFTYKDDSKLKYYGSAVKDEDKDNIWHFDSLHSDIYDYPGYGTVYTKKTFIPNHLLADGESEAYATCLGNFGVLQNYRITINNAGSNTRYLEYRLNCTSNVVVIVRDEYGNIVAPYPITKGYNTTKTTDTVASLKLSANKATTYTITTLLTTNYNGGLENALYITDTRTPIQVYEPIAETNVRDNSYTGREFVSWRDTELYISTDKLNWTHVELDQKTKSIFNGKQNTIRFYWTGNGYLVKPTLYDGIPYYTVRDFYTSVYLLDESFKLVKQYKFDNYPTSASCTDGRYYVYAGGLYYSNDFDTWCQIDSSLDTPTYALGTFGATMRNGTPMLTVNGSYFAPIVYQDFAPVYFDSLGDVFYTINGSVVYISKDAIYWESIETGLNIKSIARIDNTLLINDNATFDIPSLSVHPQVFYNVAHRQLSIPPTEADGEIYVSVRALADLLGYTLEWDEATEGITLSNGERQVLLKTNSNKAYINGDEVTLFSPIIYMGDNIVLTWQNIKTIFGYENTVWSSEYHRLVIE